jgi:outer membrane protein assembly factor BamB
MVANFDCAFAASGCGSHGGDLPPAVSDAGISKAAQALPAAKTNTTDWPTWGFDAERTAFNPNETVLSKSTVPSLKLKWSTKLGPIFSQPVLASNVLVAGGSYADIVYTGDYDGRLSAVNAATGNLIWQQQLRMALAEACGGPYGISSSPTIDRASNRIYAVDGRGILYAFGL